MSHYWINEMTPLGLGIDDDFPQEKCMYVVMLQRFHLTHLGDKCIENVVELLL